jgi:hypothetical protein
MGKPFDFVIKLKVNSTKELNALQPTAPLTTPASPKHFLNNQSIKVRRLINTASLSACFLPFP